MTKPFLSGGLIAASAAVGMTITLAAPVVSATAAPASDWSISKKIGQVQGKEAIVWSNGSASRTVAWSGGRLAVEAKGSQCAGAPVMRITVDGKLNSEFKVTNSSGWWQYATPKAIPAGSRKIQVSLTNDFGKPGCDRNIYLREVKPYRDLSNMFNQAPLFINPHYTAQTKKAADETNDAYSKKALAALGQRPTGIWLGSWTPRGKVGPYVKKLSEQASKANRIPVFVIYGMNGCLGKNGGISERDYQAWIGEIAWNIGKNRAVVILEPDALAFMKNCPATSRGLQGAVNTLSYHRSVSTYVDAGHEKWLSVPDVVGRLRSVGVQKVRGFSLNVSNSHGERANRDYGNKVSALLNKHYVIDTSRSGKPMDGQCNPVGAALGSTPRAYSSGWLDASLWVKIPGESDGSCNGGILPPGTFWPTYAVALVKNAGWKL